MIKGKPYWFWVMGSKVKVNFDTLCIKLCGHDTDCSFCPIIFKLHEQVVDNERRNPIDFGSWGQMSRSTLTLCLHNFVGTMQTAVFSPISFILHMELWMMRGGTLLIWGHVIKDQGQFDTLCIKLCGHHTDCTFYQSLSNFTCKLWTMRGEPYRFLVTGPKVKDTFDTLFTQLCGHDIDYSFCLITFKLHMQVVDDKRRNPIDFGSRDHRSRSTLTLCL